VTLPNRSARLVAYYLPQFHPIAENDEWWGRGFTEWTHVVKARPLFPGHRQPHLPKDLGFYDLRAPESRDAQASFAREHGIEGFCYWHYWFAGRRLLERPFNEVLRSGKPDFPFCLAWANESWTGIWHGSPDKILVEQTYPGEKDFAAHFEAVVEAFFDRRYMRVRGRPLFIVYKPHNLPNPRAFVEDWQERAIKAGLDGIFFVGEDWTRTFDPVAAGFDASLPHCPGLAFHNLLERLNRLERMASTPYFQLRYLYKNVPHIFCYEDFIRAADEELRDPRVQFPSVITGWDNTPRCGSKGFVLVDATPQLFTTQLRRALARIEHRPLDERIIFVKSWNEWGEGNYLEPSSVYGRELAEACRRVVPLG
jgi:hypothetical protein